GHGNPHARWMARNGRALFSLSGRRGSTRGGPFWPPTSKQLRPGARRLDGAFFPDAVFARLGHHEDRDEEHDGGDHDWIDKRVAHAARREIHRGGDDRHEASAPAVADVV